MGFAEVAKGYTPKENAEFGPNKKLVGDAVCTLNIEDITSKKGERWIVWKAVAIHPIEDPKGRETTVEPGDEIAQVFNPLDAKSIEKLMDDLFTAGISYDKAGSDDDVINSIIANAKDKLVYMRTWCRDVTDADRAKYPNKKENYWQSIKVLSANKITADNSVPVTPF